MPRADRQSSRRALVKWKGAVPLALVTAAAGYVAVTDSLAQALMRRAPAQAHALTPGDGRAAAQLAARLSGPGSNPARRAESDRLALAALRRDPTAVAAASALGVNAWVRQDQQAAAKYFAYSDKLSRRDLKTRVWVIEDAARRDDINAALRNYDIALRTSRVAPEVLLPVLVRASSEPVVADALVRMLATKPIWMDGFLTSLAATSDQPEAMARLFLSLRKAGIHATDDVNAIVVRRLVADKAFDSAWSFFQTLRGGGDRRRSRDPRFEAKSAWPTDFDWTPNTNIPGVSVTILRGDRGGVFDFAAPPSIGGPILQQLQLLPPGEYAIGGRSLGIEQPDSARPFWELSCSDGRELGRVPLPNSSADNGLFRGTFTVPPGCTSQYLRLVTRATNEVRGLSGQISEARLEPVG